MAAHASWKGFLKLSLVSVPVKAYTSTSTGSDITLHQLHAKTHTRIQYKKFAPEVGRRNSSLYFIVPLRRTKSSSIQGGESQYSGALEGFSCRHPGATRRRPPTSNRWCNCAVLPNVINDGFTDLNIVLCKFCFRTVHQIAQPFPS